MKTNAKKEALGKGISALLDNIKDDWKLDHKILNDSIRSQSNIDIPLQDIEINPFQPRADFDEAALAELADSIKVHGVIQPITVRQLENKKFQLIAGERRLRASKMANLLSIPAFVRKADDQEMLEMALIENIQREELNAVEIAINYKRLMEECKLNQEQLGHRLGKNRTTVTNYLRLLKLPPDVLSAIKTKKISMGHARAIINIEDPVAQLDILKITLEKGLNVRQVEELSKSYKTGITPQAKSPKVSKPVPLAYKKVQDELASLFSTKVQVKLGKKSAGEISIAFYSDDDFNRILDVLGR